MSEFVFVSPADPNTALGDMALASVPAVVAYLGLAVLDAVKNGDGEVELQEDGSLCVHVDVWHPRPRLVAELRRAKVIDGEP